MMKNLGTLLLILPFLILVSCGDDDSGQHFVHLYEQNEQLYGDQMEIASNDFDNAINKAIVSGDTPSGIALVLRKEEQTNSKVSLGTCTGFLITPDTLMTNSHCISQKLKQNKKLNCGDYLGFVIKSDRSSERRKCKELIQVSKISSSSKMNPDFAIVKLDKDVPNAKIYDISRDGVASEEENFIYTLDTRLINTQQVSVYSTFRKSHCIAVENSIGGVHLEERSSIIPLFKNINWAYSCKVIPGNSGSPVINTNGSAIGVVYASSNEVNNIGDSNIDMSKMQNFGLMTNFSCLDIKDHNKNRDGACGKFLADEKNQKKKYFEEFTKSSRDKLSQLIVAEFEKLPKIFVYENIAKKDTLVNMEPKCMVPYNHWSESEREKIVEKGIIFKDKEYTTSYPILEVVYSIEFDEYGVMKDKIGINSVSNKDIKIKDVDAIDSTLDNKIDIRVSGGQLRTLSRNYKHPIRLCSDVELQQNGLVAQ